MRINILFKKGCYESNTLYGFSWKRKTQPIRWHPKSRIKGWETNIRWVPSPISSASITWVCLDHENRKKFNPSSWYGCSEPSYIHEYEIEVIKFVQIWLNNMIEESIGQNRYTWKKLRAIFVPYKLFLGISRVRTILNTTFLTRQNFSWSGLKFVESFYCCLKCRDIWLQLPMALIIRNLFPLHKIFLLLIATPVPFKQHTPSLCLNF